MGTNLNDMGWVWGAYGATFAVFFVYAVSLHLRSKEKR